MYEKICKWWQEDSMITIIDLESKLGNFGVWFAYHSAKIENSEIMCANVMTVFEQNKLEGFTGNPRTVFEILNQKECYEYLKSRIVAKEPLSVGIIRKIHKILTYGTYDDRRYKVNQERPGEFKKKEYVVGINDTGAYPHEVEELMNELVEEVNAYDGVNFLKVVAYFHALFEHIHPFADGNGRVGRTMMNYYLMIHDEPPTIIYEDDRRRYYEALAAFDVEENLEPLIDFLKNQTVRTWSAKEKNARLKLSEPDC